MDILDKTYELSLSSGTWENKLIGIYAIFSKNDGKCYVGMTKDKDGFLGRWERHRKELRKNNHDNPYLQNSYNKHGESNFYMKILEVLQSETDFIERENFWIKSMDCMYFQHGYNIDDYDRYNKRRQKYRPTKRGTKYKYKKINFQFINPSGNLIKGDDLKKFSQENNLSYEHMKAVLFGKSYSHKGYISINPCFNKKSNIHKLISPDNILIEFNDIKKFSKNNNLSPSHVSKVLSKQLPHAKGWHLPNPPENLIKKISNYLKFKYLKSSDNTIYKFKKLSKFLIKNNLSNFSNFYQLFKSNAKICKGWSIPTQQELKTLPIIEENF